MLKAIPEAWWSWKYRVEQDGRVIAVLDRTLVRDRGRFVLDGVEHRIRRDGFLGPWVLERDGHEIARAHRRGFLGRSFDVVGPDRRLELRGAPFSRSYRLAHGDLEIGTMRASGWFRRSAEVDFPSELPMALRLFLVFLVVTAWKRAQAAASG